VHGDALLIARRDNEEEPPLVEQTERDLVVVIDRDGLRDRQIDVETIDPAEAKADAD
jgi:hypothetical protein